MGGQKFYLIWRYVDGTAKIKPAARPSPCFRGNGTLIYSTVHIPCRLDKALDEAPKRGWLVVDMKTDWKLIFPFQK
ncbi:hypothetical protein [Kaistia soli]|uniref:hypothetical protein n=1 Tax=Kaistia soli TaxID=446684 RepID=UPI000932FF12|nr:hypothetical protein [Kaistia soli]